MMKPITRFQCLTLSALACFIGCGFAELKAAHGNFSVTPTIKNSTTEAIEFHYDLVYYTNDRETTLPSCDRHKIQGPNTTNNVILNPGQSVFGKTEKFYDDCPKNNAKITFYVCPQKDKNCWNIKNASFGGNNELEHDTNYPIYEIYMCSPITKLFGYTHCSRKIN